MDFIDGNHMTTKNQFHAGSEYCWVFVTFSFSGVANLISGRISVRNTKRKKNPQSYNSSTKLLSLYRSLISSKYTLSIHYYTLVFYISFGNLKEACHREPYDDQHWEPVDGRHREPKDARQQEPEHACTRRTATVMKERLKLAQSKQTHTYTASWRLTEWEPLIEEWPDMTYFFLLGDDAFYFKPWLIKSFSRRTLTISEKICNYQISRGKKGCRESLPITSEFFPTTFQQCPLVVTVIVSICCIKF